MKTLSPLSEMYDINLNHLDVQLRVRLEELIYSLFELIFSHKYF